MKSPLRAAIDGRSLCGQRTGVGNYTANLLEQFLLLDPALTITLFTQQELPVFSWMDPARVEVVRGSNSYLNNFWWTNLVLRRQIMRRRVDLLHSPGYTLPLWPPIGTVVTIHDVSYAAQPQWYPYRTGAFRKSWYRSSALGADYILTDSEFSRREILRVYGVAPERVSLIYLGVDRRQFRRVQQPDLLEPLKRKHRLRERFLLFVGEIHPRRNVDRILEAFRVIRESSGELRALQLVLVGRLVESSALPRLPHDLLDSGDVRMLGHVSQEELPLLYSTACAFVFPSLYEGFGLPVLEAMACGCPVIVSQGTACAEIAGDAAILVDPYDQGSIAEAATRLLNDRNNFDSYSELGLRRAAQFSWRKTAAETLAIYRRVAGL